MPPETLADLSNGQTRIGASHVVALALSPLIDYAEEHGWSIETLLEGLPYTPEQFSEPKTEIDWSSFVTFCGRFEARMPADEGLESLKDQLVPSFKGMASFLGLMASPRLLYRWQNDWAGPRLFPAVHHEKSELLDRRTMAVTLRIPDHLEDCPFFFRMTRLMMSVAPRFLGSDDAVVDMKLAPRRADYTIRMPPSATVVARVRRALQALFSGASVLDELTDHHGRLIESHHEVELMHDELERSERNFRLIIEESPVANLVLGADDVLYANRKMREFVGLGDEESLGEHSIEDFIVDPERFHTLRDTHREGEGEFEFRKVGESQLVIGQVRAIPTQWDGSEATLLVIQDVTERNRIMARATELDRMIAMGTLASGVAHEINNPMAFIHTNLQYSLESVRDLKDSLAAVASDERIANLETSLKDALAGSERVRGIVRDLKAYSRKPEEIIARVDLREVADDAMKLAWPQIHNRARFHTDFVDVDPVLANGARLGQVVLNLILNAAQAFDGDDATHNLVTVRTRQAKSRVVVEVEDNGVGIAPRDIRKIFQPFFTTKPVGEGTGMGLWISRNIVSAMGGTLEVESEPGKGSVFRMEFTAAPDDEQSEPFVKDISPLTFPKMPKALPPSDYDTSMPKSVVVGPDRYRILVIDDEPVIGRMIKRLLDHEVVVYIDPHEALKHLRDDEDFDVILCDASMPGMTGRDFLRKIRHEFPELLPKFVLITGGLTSSWDDDDAPEILAKPFNIAELREIVERMAQEAPAA